ncbi:MAG: type II toxin-antitoxin system Phd/YefM family antitoxin [Deltaproteobacteria bacterium]|nr:type II toxin-antitoxin system Phd/YefM family antitoxin [Deltaproteobacteria bacterium]
MRTISASVARANLYRLIDEAASSSEPMRIAGKRSAVVLISDEDWASIEETLFLLSVPGLRESIMEGMKTLPEKCIRELKW